jgi:hypothetical protein
MAHPGVHAMSILTLMLAVEDCMAKIDEYLKTTPDPDAAAARAKLSAFYVNLWREAQTRH